VRSRSFHERSHEIVAARTETIAKNVAELKAEKRRNAVAG